VSLLLLLLLLVQALAAQPACLHVCCWVHWLTCMAMWETITLTCG